MKTKCLTDAHVEFQNGHASATFRSEKKKNSRETQILNAKKCQADLTIHSCYYSDK
jgi:hypothetical protein